MVGVACLLAAGGKAWARPAITDGASLTAAAGGRSVGRETPQGELMALQPIRLSDLQVLPLGTPAAAPQQPARAGSLEETRTRLQLLEQRLDPRTPPLRSNGSGREPITVLRGEAIFGLEYLNNLERIDGEPSDGKNVYVGYRLRLNIDTSFFGEDRLRIRLQSRTLPELESITGSPLTNLAFDGDTSGLVEVADLWYRFPIGKSTELNITAIGGSLRDNVPVVNPLFYGSSRGSISVFGSEDPIIRSRSGAAIGISADLSDTLNVSAAALAARAGSNRFGVFGSRNSAIAQLTYVPSKTFRGAIALTHSKNDGVLGDEFESSDLVTGNAISGEIFYQVNKRFALGLRGGLIEAVALDLPGQPRKLISSYAATIGFPDLFGKGNLLGFVLGRPPAVTYDSVDSQPDVASAHLEVFYRYMLTDNLSITPGMMFVRAPDDFGGSIDYLIGAVRMTFRF